MQMKSLLSLSLVALTFPASLWAEDAHHPQANTRSPGGSGHGDDGDDARDEGHDA